MLNNTIPQVTESVKHDYEFTSDGWPINPATGQPFTRREIVSTANDIPLPTFIDPENPPAYWTRRTPAELEAERRRLAKKRRQRQRRQTRSSQSRQTRTPPSSVELQTEERGLATADLVERTNSTGSHHDDDQVVVRDQAGQYVIRVTRDHSGHTPLRNQPIRWTRAGQTSMLEVR